MSKQSELESNAEFQRRKMMTSEERARDARNRVAVNIHEQSKREGKDIPFDKAFRKATEIAEKQLRRDQQNGK